MSIYLHSNFNRLILSKASNLLKITHFHRSINFNPPISNFHACEILRNDIAAILFSKIKTVSCIYREKLISSKIIEIIEKNNLSATLPNFYNIFNLVQPISTALMATQRGIETIWLPYSKHRFQIPHRATANQSSGTRVTRRKFPMVRSLAVQVAAITVPARLSRFDYSIKSNERTRYIRKRSVTKTTVNIDR